VNEENQIRLYCLHPFVGVLAFEYWRSVTNAARKEKKQDDSLVTLRKDVNSLTETLIQQRETIDRLTAILEKSAALVRVDNQSDRAQLPPPANVRLKPKS